MKLIVVHSHFRPGGVRRVIELALPSIVARDGLGATEVVLASGETADAAWRASLADALGEVPLTEIVDPALGYVAEQRATASVRWRRIRRCLERLLGTVSKARCVVWVHNPSLARNPDVTRALAELCRPRGIPLVLHHHDWWFDNRWGRWHESKASGAPGLSSIARAVLPIGPNVRHAAINRADAAVLSRHFPGQVGWLPNPASRPSVPDRESIRIAKRWLADRVGGEGPTWLLPARLLRRKNVAEALLLTRWLRPEARLVTTGGASSADERPYAEALGTAARRRGWRLHLGVLAGDESRSPTVGHLLGAAEVVLLTSLSEGFGLPYLEAAGASRPLIARKLRNVAPDLARFGLRFPQSYDEVHVDPGTFDFDAEVARQARRFERWRSELPAAWRRGAGEPAIYGARSRGGPVAFGRLTLVAQLEVLSMPSQDSWAACVRWNPNLAAWRRAARDGRLSVTPWPEDADRRLGAEAYALRWRRLLRRPAVRGVSAAAGVEAQADLARVRLRAENQYPLLWTPEP